MFCPGIDVPALFEGPLAPAEGDIRRGRVLQSLVIPMVIKMLDEAADLGGAIARNTPYPTIVLAHAVACREDHRIPPPKDRACHHLMTALERQAEMTEARWLHLARQGHRPRVVQGRDQVYPPRRLTDASPTSGHSQRDESRTNLRNNERSTVLG